MKTYKNLYTQICAFENLYQAFRKARRGGKRKKESVAAFELDLEANLWQLHEELQTGSYRPGPYRHFYVQERKRRLISAAPFRDRVVHHAYAQATRALENSSPRSRFDPQCLPGRDGPNTSVRLPRIVTPG